MRIGGAETEPDCRLAWSLEPSYKMVGSVFPPGYPGYFQFPFLIIRVYDIVKILQFFSSDSDLFFGFGTDISKSLLSVIIEFVFV